MNKKHSINPEYKDETLEEIAGSNAPIHSENLASTKKYWILDSEGNVQPLLNNHDEQYASTAGEDFTVESVISENSPIHQTFQISKRKYWVYDDNGELQPLLNTDEEQYTSEEDEDFSIYKKRVSAKRETAQSYLIKRKKKTLKDAILHSYYGANIKIMPDTTTIDRILIVPKRENYEDFSTEKIIDAFFTSGLSVGSVIFWIATNSYWLIYQQNENELAFFEGYAKQCKNYTISSAVGSHSTYAAISMIEDAKNDMFDETLLNRDTSILEIYIPDNSNNRQYFAMNKKLKIDGEIWRVRSVNHFSTTGIIKIKCIRSYDMTSEQIVELNPTPSTNDNTLIEGSNEIVPLRTYTYKYKGTENSNWTISSNNYIEKNINNRGELEITYTNSRKRQNFTITYGSASKNIIVKSL